MPVVGLRAGFAATRAAPGAIPGAARPAQRNRSALAGAVRHRMTAMAGAKARIHGVRGESRAPGPRGGGDDRKNEAVVEVVGQATGCQQWGVPPCSRLTSGCLAGVAGAAPMCYRHDRSAIMEASVIRTQIQLTQEQARLAKQPAAERGVSMAEFIRGALDGALRPSRRATSVSAAPWRLSVGSTQALGTVRSSTTIAWPSSKARQQVRPVSDLATCRSVFDFAARADGGIRLDEPRICPARPRITQDGRLARPRSVPWARSI